MTTTRVDTLEPIPVPEREGPPLRTLGPREWARQNLFPNWWNGLLTIVFGLILAWAIYRLGRFVLVDARWEIVQRNIRNFMVFHFPREEQWRIWAALFILAAAAGLGVGAASRRRQLREEDEPGSADRTLLLRRVGPLVAVIVVLLAAAQSLTATLLVIGVAVVAVAFRFLGARVPPARGRLLALALLVAVLASYLVIASFGGVETEDWGGLLLTVFLAVAGITLSFPLGVLLALGRRSSYPVVRWVCIAYIELVRGVPLIAILFMGAFALGFFLPPGSDPPSLVTRAIVAFVAFTSAYIAEIVRGGLQSVPQGQIEAAQAVGLSPIRTTGLIVLPQALRAVIPGIVGQFISLFKDTSLVAVIGLTEVLGVAEIITKQRDFAGQGLIVETLLFAAFVYWAGAYWMSRESQRLEQRLGVGVR